MASRRFPTSQTASPNGGVPPLPGRTLPPDPFMLDLLTLLETQGDVASETVWQELPKTIARRWRDFNKDQSPLSTLNMIRVCADEVLKIRLAKKKGMGAEEGETLREYQELLEELFQEERVEEGDDDGERYTGRMAQPQESAEEGDDEDEEED